jgi:dCMP deaminase
MVRPDWDTYFIRIAKEVSSRATCNRAAVGAVIVKDNRILSTGYNGSPAGEPHCLDVGCDIVDNQCVRTVHAEANAIIEAARLGIAIIGATLYYWDSRSRYSTSVEELTSHCDSCGKLAKKVGIGRVCGRGL